MFDHGGETRDMVEGFKGDRHEWRLDRLNSEKKIFNASNHWVCSQCGECHESLWDGLPIYGCLSKSRDKEIQDLRTTLCGIARENKRYREALEKIAERCHQAWLSQEPLDKQSIEYEVRQALKALNK